MKGKHGDHFKKNGEKIDRTTKKEGDRSLDFNMFQFNWSLEYINMLQSQNPIMASNIKLKKKILQLYLSSKSP